MASAVEFVMSLKDKITGPAKAAKASLDGVRSSLKSVDTATRAVARASGLGQQQLYRFGATSKNVGVAADMISKIVGGRTAAGFVRAHASATKLAASMPTMGQAVNAAGSGLAAMGGAALMLGTGLATVAAGGLGLAGIGAKYASEMAGFKEQTLFAYKYVTGSEDKAKMMFATAQNMARVTGGSTVSMAESMREMMAGGFSGSDAKAITLAMADVKALNPKADVGTIATQISQMKGAGKVSMNDLKPMLDAGINDDIFYQVLREMTGQKDQIKLKKMMEEGKVSADTGIAAIQETISRMGGSKGLGSIAQDRSLTTVVGQIDAAKNMVEQLFLEIQSGSTGNAFGKLATQFKNFIDPQSSSGQRILSLLNAMATGAGKVIDSLNGGTLGAILTGILSTFESLRPIAVAFFDGFGSGFGEAFTAAKAVFSALASGKGPSLDLVGIAKALGSAFAWVAVAIGSVVAVVAAVAGVVGLVVVGVGTGLVDFVGWLAETAAKLVEFSDAAPGIAGKFIGGLVNGIKDGAVSVVGAMRSLGSSAIEAVEGVFKIESPSKVMRQIGGHVAEGFTIGVDSGSPAASAAVGGLVAPSALGSVAGAGAGGGGSFSVGGITINIDGASASNPSELAQDVVEQVEAAMRSVYARWASELGASPAAI